MNIYTKFFLVLVVIGALGFAGYQYMTRPTKAPSQNPPANNEMTKEDEQTDMEESNLYSISEGSQVEYNIYEELNGEPVTVVGTTDKVYGNFVLDMDNPQEAQINTISINARTFQTDKDKRDNAVVRYILHSEDDDKEFIEFVPQQINNLPSEVEIGGQYPVTITGDMTVSGVTNPTTFDTTVYIDSADTIRIVGQGQINYKDYNLSIPELPFLANVADEVTLKLDLIATK